MARLHFSMASDGLTDWSQDCMTCAQALSDRVQLEGIDSHLGRTVLALEDFSDALVKAWLLVAVDQTSDGVTLRPSPVAVALLNMMKAVAAAPSRGPV